MNTAISTLAECDALCHAYSECEIFIVGQAGSNYVGRCDLYKTGCTYAAHSDWLFDIYETSTSIMKKYKMQTSYNFDWFEYKPEMDIVSGIN